MLIVTPTGAGAGVAGAAAFASSGASAGSLSRPVLASSTTVRPVPARIRSERSPRCAISPAHGAGAHPRHLVGGKDQFKAQLLGKPLQRVFRRVRRQIDVFLDPLIRGLGRRPSRARATRRPALRAARVCGRAAMHSGPAQGRVGSYGEGGGIGEGWVRRSLPGAEGSAASQGSRRVRVATATPSSRASLPRR